MKSLQHTFLILLTLLPLAFTQVANASNKEPFTQARFAELQQAGAVILVDVYATWCPTCAKQQKVLAAYQQANPDKKFHTLVVDFDKQKDVVASFRAPRQSTLLLYKGEQQFWYSVAETRSDVIAAELDKAFAFKAKR